MLDGYNSTQLTKKGTSGWAQALLEESVEGKKVNFYDIYIQRTKGNYICCGFGSIKCLE